jgi:hypothetical protein
LKKRRSVGRCGTPLRSTLETSAIGDKTGRRSRSPDHVRPVGTSNVSNSGTTKESAVRRFLGVLGPGLITGASDDDPSGIGTYSQAGAQFGFDIG